MPAGNMLEAFFVSLGWDTRDFDRGRRKIDKDFSDTKENARKSANDIEAAGKKAASYFRSLRNETVGLFLAFQGASSLKSFLGDLITTAASTDRLAKNMGVARNELYAWQNLAKTNGGTPGDARNALGVMADQIQSFKLTIKTGNEQNLAGLGLTRNDLTTPDHMLLKIAEAAGRMDRATYAKRLGLLGFSPEVIAMLAKGRGELEKQLEVQRKQAELTQAEADAAIAFQNALATLQTTITGKILPALTLLTTELNNLVGVIGTKDTPSSATGALFGLGIVGVIIARPFLVLAAAIGLVVTNLDYLKERWKDYEKWYHSIFGKSPDEGVITDWAGNRIGGGKIISPGNAKGADAGGAAGGAVGGMLGRGGSGAGGVSGLFIVLSSAFGTERARGIWAGIGAESGWDPNATNRAGGGQGAYGLGQWRGARLKALRARFGDRPTAAQQIQFLIWELNGGDPGGATVLGGTSAADTLSRYVGGPGWGFMRPDAAGRAGDIRRGMAILGGSRVPVSGNAPAATGSTVTIGQVNVTSPDADSFAKKDLAQKLQERGLVVQAARGMSR